MLPRQIGATETLGGSASTHNTGLTCNSLRISTKPIWDRTDGVSIPNDRKRGIGQIKGRNWDSNKHCENVKNLWQVQGLKERFIEGKSWKSTAHYSYLRNYKGKSEEYILERGRFYDLLYDKIKTSGYVAGHVGQRSSGTFTSRESLEILVTIGRDGQIYLWDGHHRFCIARILDLEVPAHVVCRHKQWQELRDEIYNKGLSEQNEELRDHPDLQDILE